MTATDPRYYKRWRVDRARGLTRTKPAQATRDHILMLREQGWTWRGIADAAHVPVATIHHVGRGEQHNVANQTQERVLALKPDSIFARPNRDGFVPNHGARRRVQALMAIGYRHQDLSPLLGFQSAVMLHQAGEWISRWKHDNTVRVYNQLWATPGPSQKARNHAARMGWSPPLAWDDDQLDNPAASPIHVVPEQDNRVDARREAFLEDVGFLAGTGATLDEAAARLGMRPDSLERRLDRLGRRDLLHRFGVAGPGVRESHKNGRKAS